MYPAKKTVVDHLGNWTLITAAGLLPLFFLPVTQDFYDINKWLLLVLSVLMITGLWTARSLLTGSMHVAWNALSKSLGLLAAAALVNLLVASPNGVEAMMAPFGPITFIALFLMTLLGTTFFDEKSRGTLSWVLYSAVSLTGLIAIYQFFGLSKVAGLSGLPGLSYLADPLWTPVGTSVGLMIILAVTLPLLIGEAMHHKKSGVDTHMIAAVLMAIAILGGLILTAIQAFPLLISGMLPYWAAWQVLLESYKNLKQLFVGVGAQNFVTAFTLGRPAILNITPIWNTRYTLSSSLLFHIATVYGLIGVAGLGYFFVSLIKDKTTLLVRISKWVALASFLLLPPSFPALVVITIFLMVHGPQSVSHMAISKKPALSYGVGIAILVIMLGSSYGLWRVYGAELAFGSSLKALENRDGTGAYNAQIKAITLSPNIARYHIGYSQTNLGMANALAGTASSSATPDQVKKDRETATQLVQQAIREAKLAVNLAPRDILAWENIAAIYQALTGVAQGADTWTVAAYQQAMQLDPTNPVIRLRLGGAYIGQQMLDRAAGSYIAAIQLKPDYANAYYNLGFVYRQQKKYLAAAQALQEALKYVTPGSEGATQGQKELDDLRTLLTEKEKSVLDNPESAQNVQPEALPTPTPKKGVTEPLSPLQ
ncbi:MAG: tetratricopeptide repeat protein [Patescibacteria group bacterium]